MSDKKRQKAGIRAKQLSMQRAKESGGKDDESQTSGLDVVIAEKGQMAEEDSTRETVQSALRRAEMSNVEIDPRVLGLFEDFKRYRIIVIAFIVVAFGIMAASMVLYNNGTIDEDMQNNMLILAAIVAVAFVAVVVGRVRPIREDINAWNKVNELALAQSKGVHGATEADVDKIFYERARNKRVPPTEEFARIRRVWFALMGLGSALILVAVFIAKDSMDDVTVPVIILIVSFALLMAAAVIDRVKMKPLREAWLVELDRKVREADKRKRRSK